MTLPLLGPSPPASRAGWVAGGTVVAIGCAALAVLSVFFDARVAGAVALLPPGAKRAAGLVSDLGQSGYMFATAILVLLLGLALGRVGRGPLAAVAAAALRERALYVLAVLAVSGLLAQLVKHLIGRARPRLMAVFGPYHFDLLSLKASLASFPSGHAATVFAMAVALGALLPWVWRVPLFAVAAGVGVSRVVVDAHFVSDVVAGGALGILSALAVARAFATWSTAFDREDGALRLRHAGAVARLVRAGPGPR